MKLALRLAVWLVVGCSLCGSVLAVGKVTVDPNLGGGAAPKVIAQNDPRLGQNVTYDAKYTSVQKILADLNEMTGVKMLAGSGASDWPVRSRKMNIFVNDVPLSNLMDSIARVMKFRWSISDTTPRTYRLVVDKKAASAADAQKANAEKASEQLWSKRRAEWIEIIMRDGKMTPEQVEETRTTDPVFYRYARGGDIRALNALFSEVPEAKDRFAAGRNFRISADKLSDGTRGLLYGAGDEFCKFMQMGRGAVVGLRNVVKRDDKYDIAYIRLDVGSFTPNSRWGIYSFGSTGYFHISKRERDLQIVDLKDKSSEIARSLCERENAIIDARERTAANTAFRARVPELVAERKREEDSLYPSEPLNQHPECDELQKTIKLRVEPPKAEQNPVLAINDYIASFQKALADTTGMGIVSDSWVSIEGEKLPDQDARLDELLEKLSAQFDYNWALSPVGEGAKPVIIEFRHRKWWKNRLNQISDGLVASWSENTRKNGVLSLDDLAQISTLNYYQAEESLRADKVLGSVYDSIVTILDMNGTLDCLRLYASLSPELRALLMGQGGVTGNGGINGHMLTSEQWKQAQVMFDRIGSDRSDAIFRLELLPDDKAVTYRFREIDTESGEEDRTWRLTLPKYAPPAATQDKSKQ